MNAADKRILTSRPWPFLDKKDTSLVTVASQQFYEIPSRIRKAKQFTITVSSQIYTPRQIASEAEWERLNRTVVTSNSVEYFFIRGTQVGFYPVPSSSSNTITTYGLSAVKDLSVADYTTGTVSALTNGASAVTGSGTTWTAPMVGRYIQFTESDTAGSGDGYWYEITSRASNTSITLTKLYAGATITSSNYTIGQMSLLPDGYHELPVYEACKIYFSSVQPDPTKFKLYSDMSKELMTQLGNDYSMSGTSIVLDDGSTTDTINPNLTISL